MYSDWKRRRAARKVKPGDGHPLQRYRWWQPLSRALLHLDIAEEGGEHHTWSVDVRLWGDKNGDVLAQLYRDGHHHAWSKLPAAFAVPGGTVEVATSAYGLKRCHYVPDAGQQRQFRPDPASAEGRRERLERTRPGLSRAIGFVSVAVLVVALILGLPQIAQEVSQIPPVAERLGTFTSPIALYGWLNIALVVATLVASTERALRLRYHWLLDGGLFDGES
ncbi:hypothetical protein [Ruania halotolerans]|uniref:hypothetical protein n=1 Tax=Ruania halotolerans TaxID=2897773 RepID=UPI001E41DCF3|nr:hypothetical protein [Ruania halotolerans]UFU08032.1 hypothetical protein LQF10_08020 [Ruania halotolerans]